METTVMVQEVDAPTVSQPSAADVQFAHQTALTLYTYEGAQVWARFNAMLVVHGIVIAAIVLLLTNIPSASASIALRMTEVVLSSIGCIVSLFWLSLTIRGFGYHDAFLKSAQRLDAEYFSVHAFPFQPYLPGPIYALGKLPIRWSAYLIIGLFVLLYLCVGIMGLLI